MDHPDYLVIPDGVEGIDAAQLMTPGPPQPRRRKGQPEEMEHVDGFSDATKQALAVTRLAGFQPDDEFLALLTEIDSGAITTDEAIERVRAKYEKETDSTPG